jgi:two-component system response regulator FixJ
VDDDFSVLGALRRLLRAAGFEVRTFDRPSALLGADIPAHNACLLLDVHLPEMTGVELKEQLVACGHDLPAVMITGRNDSQTRRLLGDATVLTKPFEEGLLLGAISRALSSAEKPRH